jgi:hypothetical protein
LGGKDFGPEGVGPVWRELLRLCGQPKQSKWILFVRCLADRRTIPGAKHHQHHERRGRGPHFGVYQFPGLEGRSAISIFVSWDGADQNAHTPLDTIAAIDPQKLEQVGRTTLLTLTVLSRETAY